MERLTKSRHDSMMPLFTRRRLQAMIDDLRLHVSAQKLKGLVACLNDKRIEQVLGTEAELALAWAFRQTHNATVEPPLPDSSRGPDLRAHHFAGTDAWIEVTAVSDADFAGDKRMRRIAQQFVEIAGSARKNLEFEFDEEMGYDKDGFFRRLLAPEDYKLTDDVTGKFKAWVAGKNGTLRVEAPGLLLNIRYTPYSLDHLNYRGRTVPALYDLERNPIYGRLDHKRRRRQLPVGQALCGVILWDAGCWAMRSSFSASPHAVSLDRIARHFIEKSGIDFVTVFTQSRSLFRRGMNEPSIEWRTMTFMAHGDSRLPLVEAEIDRVSRTLPHPRFEGYQVRSLQDRKSFDPSARGWYLAPQVVSSKGKHVMKISARALQEAMATGDFGGIASQYAGGPDGKNAFAAALMKGQAIKACTVESGGLDADDDYVVFEFGPDPAASAFTT